MIENDDLLYDEDKLVEYVKAALPESLAARIREDEIIYFVDLIDEYCEDKGFYADDAPDEADIDMEELGEFIVKQAKKNKVGAFTNEEAEEIAELIFAFEESLDDEA